MIRSQLTWKEARECARYFVRAVTKPSRQWTARTAERCLPPGWRFRYDATDDQFMPLNIENAANAFRQIAVREIADGQHRAAALGAIVEHGPELTPKQKKVLGAAFMRAQRSRRGRR